LPDKVIEAVDEEIKSKIKVVGSSSFYNARMVGSIGKSTEIKNKLQLRNIERGERLIPLLSSISLQPCKTSCIHILTHLKTAEGANLFVAEK
jgi:hypothetical protein